MNGEALLQVKHLSKTFGKNVVLRDIDFNVYPGDVTCIIGASGSGKIHTAAVHESAGNACYRRDYLPWHGYCQYRSKCIRLSGRR